MQLDDFAREFDDRRPHLIRLSNMARDVLQAALETHKVEYVSLDARVKTLNSLVEKSERKDYPSPFDATDIVGLRIVYLYRSDLDAIRDAIRAHFAILEQVDFDIHEDVGMDGYAATHFVVRANFESLYGETPIEIQCRTVGQDAWAKLEYKVLYKTGTELPVKLRRAVIGLASVYELADARFDELRKEARFIAAQERERQAVDELLPRRVTLANLKDIVERAFGVRIGAESEMTFHLMLNEFDYLSFSTFAELYPRLAASWAFAHQFVKDRLGDAILRSEAGGGWVLQVALAMADPGLLDRGWPQGLASEERAALRRRAVDGG